MKIEILILGINGSPNKNGLCASLLKNVLGCVNKNNAKTKLYHLIDIEKEFYHSNYRK